MHQLPSSIIPLLEMMKKLGASDLHMKTGLPPVYRIAGALRRTDIPPLDPDGEQIEKLMREIMPERRAHLYDEKGALDFSYHLPDGDRFRINVLRAGEHMHAAVRRVNAVIPSFEDLHLPPIYRKVAQEAHEGLVLVVGVTGCGKSTTMAAMLDHVNATRPVHIISVEDPVEFLLKPKKAIISQREIGLDLESFADGLRSAVRQDPDVIFVGELRDRETITAALQAAETGHLVFGTLHTADTMQTLTRILEFFSHDEHEFIRSAVANSLQAVFAQRLLPAADPKISRVPATEVLLGEPIVTDKIRNGEDEDLPAVIASNEEGGMHSFTRSLVRLYNEELVFLDTAMEYAPHREQLESEIRGIKTTAQSLVHRVKRRDGG